VAWPDVPFDIEPSEIWLEVGFGGGEHAFALATANPDVGLIAAEVFETGICSLLSKLAPENPLSPVMPANAGIHDLVSTVQTCAISGSQAPPPSAPAPPANLRIFTDDARPLIRDMGDESLDKLFLMFPDPWPKARHAKRRFVHPVMVAEVARVLRPGGEWRIASDDPTYQAWTDEVLAGQDLFAVARHETRPAGWPGTRYEAKAKVAGRGAVYWALTRR